MSTLNCPNCGAGLELSSSIVTVINCTHCNTTSLIEKNIAVLSKPGGDMLDAPELVHIGDRIEILKQSFQVFGHARFDYGRGHWDEYFLISDQGDGYWLNADAGDVSLQKAIAADQLSSNLQRINVNNLPKTSDKLEHGGETYIVKEIGKSTCIAVRGQFDEWLEVGEEYRYIDAENDGEALLSGEFWKDGQSWFQGYWVSSRDVKVIA